MKLDLTVPYFLSHPVLVARDEATFAIHNISRTLTNLSLLGVELTSHIGRSCIGLIPNQLAHVDDVL